MDRDERLEKGEKFLVFAVMAVLGIEGFFTILAANIRFSWLGVIWSVGSSFFMLGLANRIYTGNRTAYTVTSVWSGFQVVLSLVILLVLAFRPEAEHATAHLALPVLWMAAVKLIGYSILSVALFLTPRVKDFLDVQRGGELEPENPMAPTGVVVTFADDQKAVIASLGKLLSGAGVVLIVLGVLQGLVGLREFIAIANSERGAALQSLTLWLFIRFLPAIATLSIGVLMFKPASAAKLIQTQGADMSYIMNALFKLRGFFSCLVVLILIQVLGALLGVPLF
ncbi:MAG: hypothetical protein U0793_33285 [Gemmataceae bacterium]